MTYESRNYDGELALNLIFGGLKMGHKDNNFGVYESRRTATTDPIMPHKMSKSNSDWKLERSFGKDELGDLNSAGNYEFVVYMGLVDKWHDATFPIIQIGSGPNLDLSMERDASGNLKSEPTGFTQTNVLDNISWTDSGVNITRDNLGEDWNTQLNPTLFQPDYNNKIGIQNEEDILYRFLIEVPPTQLSGVSDDVTIFIEDRGTEENSAYLSLYAKDDDPLGASGLGLPTGNTISDWQQLFGSGYENLGKAEEDDDHNHYNRFTKEFFEQQNVKNYFEAFVASGGDLTKAPVIFDATGGNPTTIYNFDDNFVNDLFWTSGQKDEIAETLRDSRNNDGSNPVLPDFDGYKFSGLGLIPVVSHGNTAEEARNKLMDMVNRLNLQIDALLDKNRSLENNWKITASLLYDKEERSANYFSVYMENAAEIFDNWNTTLPGVIKGMYTIPQAYEESQSANVVDVFAGITMALGVLGSASGFLGVAAPGAINYLNLGITVAGSISGQLNPLFDDLKETTIYNKLAEEYNVDLTDLSKERWRKLIEEHHKDTNKVGLLDQLKLMQTEIDIRYKEDPSTYHIMKELMSELIVQGGKAEKTFYDSMSALLGISGQLNIGSFSEDEHENKFELSTSSDYEKHPNHDLITQHAGEFGNELLESGWTKIRFGIHDTNYRWKMHKGGAKKYFDEGYNFIAAEHDDVFGDGVTKVFTYGFKKDGSVGWLADDKASGYISEANSRPVWSSSPETLIWTFYGTKLDKMGGGTESNWIGDWIHDADNWWG